MYQEKTPRGKVPCAVKLDSQVTDDLLVLSKLQSSNLWESSLMASLPALQKGIFFIKV